MDRRLCYIVQLDLQYVKRINSVQLGFALDSANVDVSVHLWSTCHMKNIEIGLLVSSRVPKLKPVTVKIDITPVVRSGLAQPFPPRFTTSKNNIYTPLRCAPTNDPRSASARAIWPLLVLDESTSQKISGILDKTLHDTDTREVAQRLMVESLSQ